MNIRIKMRSNETPKEGVFYFAQKRGGDMTPEQAKAFLSRTEWYEMAELAKIQPMPDHVREMRRIAEEVLKQTHINAIGEG